MKAKMLTAVVAAVIVLTCVRATLSAQADKRQWATEQGKFFSFQYPSDWKVQSVDSGQGPNVVILPSDADPLKGKHIDIAYLSFEINEGEALQKWHDLNFRASMGNTSDEIKILSNKTVTQVDGTQRQELHTSVITALGPSQTVEVTNGRLVLSLSAYTLDDDMRQVLQRIAESVVFSADAPKTLGELLHTNQKLPSLADTIANNSRGGIDYKDTVTRDREAAEKLPPLPTVTPIPDIPDPLPTGTLFTNASKLLISLLVIVLFLKAID